MLEPFRQRRFAAAYRTQQIENLFLFLQPLRGVAKVGHNLLDGVLHPIEFFKSGIDLENLVLENARQTLVIAGVDHLRIADGCQQSFSGAGVNGRVGFAQFQVVLEGQHLFAALFVARQVAVENFHDLTSLWNRGSAAASGSNSPVDVLKKIMQITNHSLFFGQYPDLEFQRDLGMPKADIFH